jgi:hypothetical protein
MSCSSPPAADSGFVGFLVRMDDVVYTSASEGLRTIACVFPKGDGGLILPRNLICVCGCVFAGEQVRGKCFKSSQSLPRATAETGSRVSELERCIFAVRSSLSSICIPSSVGVLCEECFYSCKALSTVTFEVGSTLSRIATSAFSDCSSLSSISVP